MRRGRIIRSGVLKVRDLDLDDTVDTVQENVAGTDVAVDEAGQAHVVQS